MTLIGGDFYPWYYLNISEAYTVVDAYLIDLEINTQGTGSWLAASTASVGVQ